MVEWNEDQAREMLASGSSLKTVGVYFGIDGKTVRGRLDPEYAALRRADVQRNRKRRRGHEMRAYSTERLMRRADTTLSRDELEERFREIPPDHRDLTGFMFGDPLPGRSALDQKRSQAA